MANEKQINTRLPVVAGSFYPRKENELLISLQDSFNDRLGPGKTPVLVHGGTKNIFGLICAHAGYYYSGSAVAHSILALDGEDIYDAVVILGLNHRLAGYPIAASSDDYWRTPLGDIRVAYELNAKLMEMTDKIKCDNRAHMNEHSIEVQLPFIQYIMPNVPIVPISIGDARIADLQELGSALATLANQHRILFIASTDLTHYENQREARRKDAIAMDKIAAIDIDGLLTVVRKNGISMCGVLPTCTLLAAAKESGIKFGKILHYHTSGDVSGDLNRVVGYGSMVFTK
jgi:AmmeMemoRadiSam system protein B